MAPKLTLLALVELSLCLLPCVLSANNVEQDGITVPRENVTVFSGDETMFIRLCRYTGSEELERLEWLENGQVYSEPGDLNYGEGTLLLSIQNITSSHQGEYSCQAVLSSGSIAGPVSAGFLNVLDPSIIIAPPVQYVLQNSSITLQCSTNYPNTHTFWSSQISTFANAQITDERIYRCSIAFSDFGTLTAIRDVQLMVIVPPCITSSNETELTVSGNTPLSLAATFQSRTQDLTTITWDKLTSSLPTGAQTNTVWSTDDSLDGTTSLSFSSIARADSGLYRLRVTNSHEVIPESQRTASLEIALTVEVPPSLPSGLSASPIDNTRYRITWTLTHQTEDEAATSLSLNIVSPSQSVIEVPSSSEEFVLEVEPGNRYSLTLTAMNADGQLTTQPLSFDTDPAAPLISSVEAQRLNSTAVNLTLYLHYTGGGDITHLTLSFSPSSVTISDIVPSQIGTSNRVWNTVVVNDLLETAEYLGQQFSVAVTNQRTLVSSTTVEQSIILPGAPSVPVIVPLTENTFTIQVQISDSGTEPLLKVNLEITSPEQQTTYYNQTGQFSNGQTVEFTVGDLKPSSTYTVVSYVVNAGGQGPSSDAATVNTEGTSLPISLEALIGITVVGSVVLTISLILSIICCFYCYKCCKTRNGQRYCTADYKEEPKALEASDELVSKNYGNGYPHLLVRGEGTYTPRSPTITSRASSCLPPAGPGTEYSYEGSEVDVFPVLHRRQPDFVDGNSYNHFQYRHSPAPLSLTPEQILSTSSSVLSPDPDVGSPPLTAFSYATDV